MNQLGLFAKFWQPGTVKTRLAASIGNDAACKIYQSFVAHLVQQLATTADQRWVVYSPQEREREFRQQIPLAWKLAPQTPGDLGVRMKSFFEQRFENESNATRSASGYHKVVVIGADCPHLTASTIELAFQQLEEVPVVIGPSTDGGYYLIAMRDPCQDIFSDIQWSSETVLESTIARLDNQQVDYKTLPELTDVDEFDDLVALERYLSQEPSNVPSDDSTGLLSQVQAAISTHRSGASDSETS